MQQGSATFTPYAPGPVVRVPRPEAVVSARRNGSTFHETVDSLHRALRQLPPRECPLTHRFTPGLYSREILMPRKTAVISKVHKTEHQFAVLQGRVLVWSDGHFKDYKAGDVGITKPGTRRVLYVVDDCRWITFHPTTETDLVKLEKELVETIEVPPVEGDKKSMDILTQLRRFALENGD